MFEYSHIPVQAGGFHEYLRHLMASQRPYYICIINIHEIIFKCYMYHLFLIKMYIFTVVLVIENNIGLNYKFFSMSLI